MIPNCNNSISRNFCKSLVSSSVPFRQCDNHGGYLVACGDGIVKPNFVHKSRPIRRVRLIIIGNRPHVVRMRL